MSESEKNSEMASTNSLGLKAFNQTGRDDTTTQILRPKTDPKVRTRNLILTMFVVVGMCIAFYIAYQRSGIRPEDIVKPNTGGIGVGHDRATQNTDN